METNGEMADKLYPENWSVNVAADALQIFLEGKGKPLEIERSSSTQSPKM